MVKAWHHAQEFLQDFLMSLKMLVIRRTKVIRHEELAEKFDLKMLHALGMSYFKHDSLDELNEHAINYEYPLLRLRCITTSFNLLISAGKLNILILGAVLLITKCLVVSSVVPLILAICTGKRTCI